MKEIFDQMIFQESFSDIFCLIEVTLYHFYIFTFSGRTRATNSLYMMIGPNVKEKEKKLREEEILMNEAVMKVSNMNDVTFRENLEPLQAAMRVQKKLKESQIQFNNVFKTTSDIEYELLCRNCNAFLCDAKHIRLLGGSQYVCCDPDFHTHAKLDHTEPCLQSRKPEKLPSLAQILCKSMNCAHMWGKQSSFKRMFVPVISCAAFVVVEKTSKCNRVLYNRWKEVPFDVSDVTEEDEINMAQCTKRMMTHS